MDLQIAGDLEQWLRKEASERIQRSALRRDYARAYRNLSDEDRKCAHALAERMHGRKFPRQSRAEDEANARIQERIATKLEDETAMILRFADFVSFMRNMSKEA